MARRLMPRSSWGAQRVFNPIQSTHSRIPCSTHAILCTVSAISPVVVFFFTCFLFSKSLSFDNNVNMPSRAQKSNGKHILFFLGLYKLCICMAFKYMITQKRYIYNILTELMTIKLLSIHDAMPHTAKAASHSNNVFFVCFSV